MSQRRTEALSRERIVAAAIEILDSDGEAALTFRALATRLNTGAGAIYHHVADKNALLAAAADSIVARALPSAPDDGEPEAAIRAIALAVFDAFDAHPWVGAQLHRRPWSALLQIFESIGGRMDALGVPQGAQFNSASALLNYILGVAGQNAANARSQVAGPDRTAFLAEVAAQWTRRDPVRYPFVHQVAGQLADHDDRDQYLAGIDLILAGIANVR
ncbi:TetR family transcriptional regulator [Mycolicibacterium cosmeticum]|uniref:TetR family transcriptional regulator n=2 Tax=Mycolicibacterium TaxID=1866885 RepID=W9AUY1_MYCCO|nr:MULTISPECIES: TetR family transcriptional regulator [Mycolicibacterium]MCV7209796.1 TetR family transcriptional regulator [Mycolicibacterium canariasense]ORU99692.1 TetR family transcriptional regulator [Mycolicibacterium canariasense]TLH74932.1 TetR family transcriptional regulator [Mycolicibacterium cosmeticum]CDO09343.1 TetR family transcriptional regulator [Mycolicibacterium cosmeticum]GAS97808.1 TetR family transcriptional regulator [Mycolicibacterium canariasense]